MKTPIYLCAALMAIFLQTPLKGKCKTFTPKRPIERITGSNQTTQPLPCYATVTVPKTGNILDCNGIPYFINASGTCTSFNELCDYAFQEAWNCAKAKADEDYRRQVSMVKTYNCAVKTISAQ